MLGVEAHRGLSVMGDVRLVAPERGVAAPQDVGKLSGAATVGLGKALSTVPVVSITCLACFLRRHARAGAWGSGVLLSIQRGVSHLLRRLGDCIWKCPSIYRYGCRWPAQPPPPISRAPVVPLLLLQACPR